MLPSSCHPCFYNINLMLYWPNIIRFSLVLVLGVLIAGVSSDSLLADTDEDPYEYPGHELTIEQAHKVDPDLVVGDVVEEWTLKGAWCQAVNFGDVTFEDSTPVEISVTLRYDFAILQF